MVQAPDCLALLVLGQALAQADPSCFAVQCRLLLRLRGADDLPGARAQAVDGAGLPAPAGKFNAGQKIYARWIAGPSWS